MVQSYGETSLDWLLVRLQNSPDTLGHGLAVASKIKCVWIIQQLCSLIEFGCLENYIPTKPA